MVKRLSWTRGLLLALMAALAGATVAFGHPLYAQATARGPVICVGTSSSLAEGPASNGGQAFVEGWWQAWGNSVCLTAKNMAAGDAVVRRELYRWNGVEWRLCATNGWLYNSEPTSYMYRSQTWAPMPCGNNSYYGHYGLSYGWASGQWHGPGYVWSGYHFI